MTKIKICGITTETEAGLLNKYMPDYAGFVFAQSRRRVSPERAAGLVRLLSRNIKKVGVFVNHDVGTTAEIARLACLDAVQLHGEEDGAYVCALRKLLGPGVEIWKAFRIDAAHRPDKNDFAGSHADRILLDAYVEGSYGGTGRRFDWELVKNMRTELPVVLAGGLNPDNVRLAMETASPYAVDTSSGVETDGMKDEEKLRAFINAVRKGPVY